MDIFGLFYGFYLWLISPNKINYHLILRYAVLISLNNYIMLREEYFGISYKNCYEEILQPLNEFLP